MVLVSDEQSLSSHLHTRKFDLQDRIYCTYHQWFYPEDVHSYKCISNHLEGQCIQIPCHNKNLYILNIVMVRKMMIIFNVSYFKLALSVKYRDELKGGPQVP